MPDLRPGDPKVLLVIPVFNHGGTLRDVVTRALAVHREVLVVNDGSSDGGIESLAGLPIRIIGHQKNLGKGTAILAAAAEARRMGMTHVVTIDADGQHDPADVDYFLPVLRKHPLAIVVGTRNFNIPGVPRASRFGRSFSNFWLRVQTGQVLRDTQSGFRAYPLAVLEELRLRERRYAFEVEVLVKAAWAGVELREIPISVRYPPAGERVSHFRLFRDNLRISLLNTRLTLRALVPLTHRKILRRDGDGPRASVWHPLRSIKALLRENSSPGEIAAAGALGVFLGALPLIAIHTVVILLAAGFFRLNKVAALTSSQLCMPPFVPALCIEAGYFFRHGEFLTEISLRSLGYEGLERIFEWLIGSLLLAPLLAIGVGSVLYGLALAAKRGSHGST